DLNKRSVSLRCKLFDLTGGTVDVPAAAMLLGHLLTLQPPVHLDQLTLQPAIIRLRDRSAEYPDILLVGWIVEKQTARVIFSSVGASAAHDMHPTGGAVRTTTRQDQEKDADVSHDSPLRSRRLEIAVLPQVHLLAALLALEIRGEGRQSRIARVLHLIENVLFGRHAKGIERHHEPHDVLDRTGRGVPLFEVREARNFPLLFRHVSSLSSQQLVSARSGPESA